MRLLKARLSDQVIVLLGAGSAGVGIARLIVDAMVEEGTPRDIARSKIYTLDSQGLVERGRTSLDEHKIEFAVDPERIATWPKPAAGAHHSLLEVVRFARPTVLFGVSGQPNTFTEVRISRYCCAKKKKKQTKSICSSSDHLSHTRYSLPHHREPGRCA